MSVVQADLILLTSLNMPEDDISTSGGGIDVDNRPVFVQMGANDTIEALSDNAGDTTQDVTVTARQADGTIVSETKTLTGTTFISFSTLSTVERILKVVLSADCTGTITIRRTTGSTLIADIPPAERGFRIVFYNSSSDPATTKTRYEKLFYKNTNGTTALTGAKVTLTADPSTKLTIDLESTKDGTGSSADRLTAPTYNIGTYVGTGTSINVPTGNLGAGEAIGVVIKQSLSAGDSPIKNTFDLKLEGATT